MGFEKPEHQQGQHDDRSADRHSRNRQLRLLWSLELRGEVDVVEEEHQIAVFVLIRFV